MNLDRFHKWSVIMDQHNKQGQCRKGQVHKYIQPPTKGPTENRRDDLRFNLRAKMSQKDYVDKDMRYFHFQKEKMSILQEELAEGGDGARLEALKKQINQLKRCMP